MSIVDTKILFYQTVLKTEEVEHGPTGHRGTAGIQPGQGILQLNTLHITSISTTLALVDPVKLKLGFVGQGFWNYKKGFWKPLSKILNFWLHQRVH